MTLKIISIVALLIVQSPTYGSTQSLWSGGPLQIEPEATFPLPVGSASEGIFDLPGDTYRLPLVAIPESVELRSMPILFEPTDAHPGHVRFTAPGRVTIVAKCVATSNNITLHAFNLTMKDVQVQDAGDGSALIVSDHGYSDVTKDFYTIHLKNPIQNNSNYKIIINYEAPISQTGQYLGLYLSQYTGDDGNQHILSTTKFEPYHARKAFPAFDEPNLKAKYKIFLARRKDFADYHTLSNCKLLTTSDDLDLPNWVWDEYEESPPMSTYQVTMIVSDFTSAKVDTPIIGKPVQIWAAPHLIGQGSGQYSADLVDGIINYYQTRFGMDYHLLKMDSVAVPQFPSGAMEQWGLNTYRAEYLLYNADLNSEAERRRVTSILSHELAHQWFGNAVVCAWWNDIWLNEGFATYLSFQAMDVLKPEFEAEKRFFIDATAIAMTFDQGPKTHPIHHYVEVPTEISSLFSDINYEKAACIIRMLENVFGNVNVLNDGLKIYLNRMNLKAAEQNDLFTALQEVNPNPDGLTVKEFLDTWTLQSGYPIVRVSRVTKDRVYLSQEKFILDPQARQNSLKTKVNDLDPNDLWHIPVALVTAANPGPNKSPVVWIHKNELSIPYGTNIDTTNWILVNPESAGYFRVLYDETLTANLLKQLETDASVFGAISRSQLMNDYFNFALANYIQIEEALIFTKHLAQETELIGWTVTWNFLRDPFLIFSDNLEDATIFRDYFIPRIEGAFSVIGLEHPVGGQIGTKMILRPTLLDYASAMDHPASIEYAQKLFRDWKDNGNPILVDYQAVAYCAVTRSSVGDEADIFLYEKYQAEADNVPHRIRLLKALGCTKNTDTLSQLLNDALSSTKILSEDRIPLMQAIAGRREGRALLVQFIRDHYREEPLTPEAVVTLVSRMSPLVTDPTIIDRLTTFVNEQADAATRPDLNAHLAVMKANAEFRTNGRGQRMLKWFQENK